MVVGTVPLYSQTSSSLPHEDSTTCLITDDEDEDDQTNDNDGGDDDDEDEDDCSSSSDAYLPTSDSSTAICMTGRTVKNIRKSTNKIDSVASTSSSTKPERSSSSVSLSLRKGPETLKDTRKSIGLICRISHNIKIGLI